MSEEDDENPDEGDGGKHPSTGLELDRVGRVVVEEGDQAHSDTEKSVDGGTNDAPFAPGGGARYDGEEDHQDEGDASSNVGILELYRRLDTEKIVDNGFTYNQLKARPGLLVNLGLEGVLGDVGVGLVLGDFGHKVDAKGLEQRVFHGVADGVEGLRKSIELILIWEILVLERRGVLGKLRPEIIRDVANVGDGVLDGRPS